jgi:hypothetical protein
MEVQMKVIFLIVFLTVAGVCNASTVLYQDRVVPVETTLADPNDLWVAASQLSSINGFELKDEGACLDDICIPVRQDEDSNLFVNRNSQGWLNITELARRLQQPYVVDHESDVWSFGTIPVTRNAFVRDHLAPDFVLNDKTGKPVRLSQFKDKKVLLITWASW